MFSFGIFSESVLKCGATYIIVLWQFGDISSYSATIVPEAYLSSSPPLDRSSTCSQAPSPVPWQKFGLFNKRKTLPTTSTRLQNSNRNTELNDGINLDMTVNKRRAQFCPAGFGCRSNWVQNDALRRLSAVQTCAHSSAVC